MEEKMNKSQRRRTKRSDESSAIFKGKSGNYENIYQLWVFVFCYTGLKYFGFCYIYVNWP